MTETDALIRMGAALLAGGILGFEREITEKPAGIRTFALVCEGAALFMIIALLLDEKAHERGEIADPSRIASTVVQGIGFLAGGVIFTIRSRVRGLTTAAGIWVAAAVGLFIGSGYFVLGFGAVALSIVALLVFGWIEEKLPRNNTRRHKSPVETI